jgi:hypothetical protein
MLSNATIIKNDDGSSNVALFLDGEAYLAHSSHANYKQIVDAIASGDESADFEALFDTGKLIQGQFEQALGQVEDTDLSERVSVRGGQVTLDGDPVSGSLEDQILAFVRAGEDFGPLVRFYEKLVTNPLGNVKQGVFDWITGQTENGDGITVTEDGNLLGYKAVTSGEKGYRPSRASYAGGDRVNGVEVPAGEYIWQNIGDVVEMPRSKVLNEPTRECGTGLHIGTYNYASSFTGDTVLLVEFNPRDIVSLPDSNASWKLRVCRYRVVDVVTEPLSVPVYMKQADEPKKETAGISEGLRVVDYEGDTGTVIVNDDGYFMVEYDNDAYGTEFIDDKSVEHGTFTIKESEEPDKDRRTGAPDRRGGHGKGGKHSKAAEGRGLNPAQDPSTGQFVAGRPGSGRDRSGRFTS